MTLWPIKFTKKEMFPVVVLFLSLLFVFGPESNKEFLLWDDESLLSQHKPFLPVNWNTFAEIATSPFPSEYIPLTKVVWALIILPMQWSSGQSWSSENWVQPFVIASILFHFFNCLLLKEIFPILFNKAGKEKDWKDWLPIFIYALHPIQVEALASIAEIREPMWIFFGLLSLLTYLQCRLRLSLLFFLLAVLSKPTATIIAGVIVVVHLVKNRTQLYKIKHLKYYFCALGVSIVLAILKNVSINESKFFLASYQMRLYSFIDSCGFYIIKILLPFNLAADYGRTYSWLSLQGWTAEMSFFCVFVIFMIAACIRLKEHRSNILILLSLLLFPLFPVSGLIEFSMQIYSNVADHYASFSIAALAGVICLLSQRIRWLYIFTILICSFYFVASYMQKRTWQNNKTFAEHTLKVNPQSFMAHNNLGLHLLRENEDLAALREFSDSIKINPTIPNPYLNSAVVLNRRLQFTEALSLLEAGMKNIPKNTKITLSLADTLVKLGRLDEAIEVYKIGKIDFPGNAHFSFNLGLVYWKKNQFELALEELRMAKDLYPWNKQFAETYLKSEELYKKIKSLK